MKILTIYGCEADSNLYVTSKVITEKISLEWEFYIVSIF